MLSIQTEARIAKLFLEISRGENNIETTRRIMTNNYDFDSYQIFNYLDIKNKNRIDSLDIMNYLIYKQFSINDIESQLIILFYDQNFDGVLTFDEFKSLLLNENALNSKPTAINFLGKVSPEIDDCLFHILINEVRLARNCISILQELKMRKDFNIHSIYHLLRGLNCINCQNIKDFMNKKDVILSENDLISICKRLDLNKDGKIDLCELHAFFGYPDCSICCLSSPCTSCGIKDCNICFKDSVCYFHNRIHDDIFSKYIKENENIKENKFLFMEDLEKLNSQKKIDANNDNNEDFHQYNEKDENFKNKTQNNNNYKTFTQIKYDYNEKYNFNYNNSSTPKSLTLINNNKKNKSLANNISKKLILRASPERKFNPNRISIPFNSNDINSKDKKNKNSEINTDINDYLNNRLKIDEKQFLNYLMEIMITEKKIEEQKIKLSLNKDFNCEDAFRIFEGDSKDFISKEELKYGLYLLNINTSNLDLDLLMKQFSLKKEGILLFGNFFDIVVPFDKEYRNMVEERIPNSINVIRSPNIFSFKTGNELKELFNLIIKEENKLNNIRKNFSRSLKKINLEEYFKEIDIMRNRYFNEHELLKYIKKKGIFVDENVSDLLFIRLDKNRNGIVEFEEIEKEINSVFF